ncbi:MAG: hypothetical protein U5L11_10445 [Arhodomonas sp.]|nr:hypothetical protein [Arhodomonas sp.]
MSRIHLRGLESGSPDGRTCVPQRRSPRGEGRSAWADRCGGSSRRRPGRCSRKAGGGTSRALEGVGVAVTRPRGRTHALAALPAGRARRRWSCPPSS